MKMDKVAGSKITFRSPNYKDGEPITLQGFKLDDSKVSCNHCGAELTQKENVPSIIKFHKKDEKRNIIVIKYLCFNCIEKLTGRRPDNE